MNVGNCEVTRDQIERDFGKGWINVLHHLPPTCGISVQYLVAYFDAEGGMLDACVVAWQNIGGWNWSDEYADRIRYWMPIPEIKEIA
jgi:hypothetical protein